MKDRDKRHNVSDSPESTKRRRLEMENQKVWVPDPLEGFVIGVIQDIALDEATVMRLNDRQLVKVSYDSLYPSGELIKQDYEDNCSLMYLNEGSFLIISE